MYVAPREMYRDSRSSCLLDTTIVVVINWACRQYVKLCGRFVTVTYHLCLCLSFSLTLSVSVCLPVSPAYPLFPHKSSKSK